ncbi:fibroblast growth factor receptor 3 IIIb-like protein [Leptotrombidium deliense]|uniref:Fibroblast growth factor receptor 3 IIIb-like protein n=1 Tax=Leptotrombidium deliense TaxID=299467 RepID=A0A443SI05_9ACAR|nr:fibroblast growth factor receptor 3 IIIb-like protein [Leptotrombidium deliense]
MFNGLIVLIILKLNANCAANGEIKENITLTVGDTLKLYCPPSVTSRSHLIWYLNASAVEQGDYNAQIFDRYLIISNLTEENEGIYSCKGTKKVVKNSATFDVKIIRSDDDNGVLNSTNGFAPVFIKQNLMTPWYISRFTGQSVRFNCPYRGDPKPNIVWLKDSHPIRRLNGFIFEYLKGYILYVENLLQSDSGMYTCIVSNIHGSTNHTYQLAVINKFNHPPLFHRGKEETVYAKISNDVELDCTFDDDFDTRWIWVRLWKVNNTDINEVKKGLKVTEDGEWFYETIEVSLYTVLDIKMHDCPKLYIYY